MGFDGRGFFAGARNMVSVAVATAAAGIIVGVVTLGLGDLITDVVDQLSQGNIHAMLAITAAASLLLGMGLPTTATYIVMASLTAPVIVTIADAQGFMYDIRAAILPFVFIFNHDLLLWNITSWSKALMIFAMACIGAFASAT